MTGHKVCPYGLSRVLLILAFCGLTGCASQRVIPEDLEALVVQNCQAGCAVVPYSLWQQIQQFLTQRGARI